MPQSATSLILIWWYKRSILTFLNYTFSNTTHTLPHTYCVNTLHTCDLDQGRKKYWVNEQYRLTLMGKSNRDTKLKLNKTPDSCWKSDEVRGLLNMLLQIIHADNDVLLHQKLSDIAASNSHHLTKILRSDSLGQNGGWQPIYGNCFRHNIYLMNVR